MSNRDPFGYDGATAVPNEASPVVRKRLFWRLCPLYVLITVVSLWSATWYATRQVRSFYIVQREEDLRQRLRVLEPQFSGLVTDGVWPQVNALCKDLGRRSGTRITVILPTGQVVGDSDNDPERMDNHADRPEVAAALQGRQEPSVRYSKSVGAEMLYLALPVKRNDQLAYVLRLSVPVTAINKALRTVNLRMALAGVLITVAAAGASLWVSVGISRPLAQLRTGAERFALGDFGQKLPIHETEEIGGLARALNQMADQLSARLRKMAEQRNELEAVLASMEEGVLAIDLDERLISINRAAAALFRVEREVVQGHVIQEVVRNADLLRFVSGALAGDDPMESDIDLHDGSGRQMKAHATALCNTEGRRIGTLIVLNDVTRLRRLETVRRDFVANVSHELRTPITSIKGFVETLLDGAIEDAERAVRFLKIIGKQADRLNAIVEDLLALSRLEEASGRDQIPLEMARIAPVLATAVEVCHEKAEARRIELSVTCPESLQARINALLLEQALVNLIDNAIKHSEEGGQVDIGAAEQEDEVVLSVRDRGCGISSEHIPRLFERFYRVDKARSRDMGGTGLGLAIVKHIAQTHGGRASVESELGRGSTFRIHLPKPRPSPA